jgi:hypothetical protein
VDGGNRVGGGRFGGEGVEVGRVGERWDEELKGENVGEGGWEVGRERWGEGLEGESFEGEGVEGG